MVIAIIIIMLALPSSLKLLEAVLQKYGFTIPFIDLFSGKVFFVLFAMFAYVITMKVVTNKKIYFKYAFIGAFIFAAGITIAKFIFQWYLYMTFSRYNVIYGSLTALILTVFWIYYLSIILLLSAEVVAYLHKRREK